MSERTTIGGTVYETIGSSTSNLLLDPTVLIYY